MSSAPSAVRPTSLPRTGAIRDNVIEVVSPALEDLTPDPANIGIARPLITTPENASTMLWPQPPRPTSGHCEGPGGLEPRGSGIGVQLRR